MKTLKDLILSEHSKAQANVIAGIVSQKPELIKDLLAYTFANEEPLSRRASWPLRILNANNPALLKEEIEGIITQLEDIKSTAVLRNILALLVASDLPESRKMHLLDFATQTILNTESTIAVIAYATDLFVKIADDEIILINELVLMLEQIAPQGSGGILAKLHNMQKHLQKLKKAKIKQ